MQEITIRFEKFTLILDVPAERVTFIFHGVGRPDPISMPLDQLINLLHVARKKMGVG